MSKSKPKVPVEELNPNTQKKHSKRQRQPEEIHVSTDKPKANELNSATRF